MQGTWKTSPAIFGIQVFLPESQWWNILAKDVLDGCMNEWLHPYHECILMASWVYFAFIWRKILTKEAMAAKGICTFWIIPDFIEEKQENQLSSKSLMVGGAVERCDGVRWGRGCRNMSVCIFKAVFLLRGGRKKNCSLTGKRIAADQSMEWLF